MLKIDVRNFRGIKTALLECSSIALLCGPNFQGKSSTIEAIRFALDGTDKPYGLTKELVQTKLVHRGEPESRVVLEIDDRALQMRWPSGERQSNGQEIRASVFATGGTRYVALDKRQQAFALSRFLKAEPLQEEFYAALDQLSGLEFNSEQRGVIWVDIQRLGWDNAFLEYKEKGTKAKGAWEALTAANYGSKIGGTWRPKGWSPEHEAFTDEQIAGWLKDAREALEEAIGKVAINDDERKRLEASTKQIPKLEEAAKTRRSDLDVAEKTRKAAETKLKKVPVLPDENWPACPHCRKPVQVLGNNTLQVPPPKLDDAERKKIEHLLQDAQMAFDAANTAHNEAYGAWEKATKDLQAAKDSKAALENADPAASAQQPQSLDEMRADVLGWEQITKFKDKIRKALLHHIEIQRLAAVVGLMAPEGLRKTKMADKLGRFNTKLSEMCEVAGWAAVALNPDGVPQLGETPYVLLSESERMRVDVTLQVAFAMMDGSEIILVDRADTLDGRGRNGLFALLQWSERYAVVAMMLVKSKEAPDLAAAGFGQTFWIEAAVATPLEAYRAQRAA